MSVVAYAAGWGIWILVAVLALFAWHSVLVDVLVGRRVRFINTASAVVLTWLASWFVILDQLNKLHLLWILPTVFVVIDLLRPESGAARRGVVSRWHHRPQAAIAPEGVAEKLPKVKPSP